MREDLPACRSGERAWPTADQCEVLAALWAHELLFANQIWRRWWPDRTERWVYQALKRMGQSGWVHRYRLVLAGGGTQQRFYGLAQPGFEVIRGRRAGERVLVSRQARWQRLVVDEHQACLPRPLHVNGWVLAFERLVGELMSGWRGRSETGQRPPRQRVRGRWIDLRPTDIVLGTSHRLIGYQATSLEAVAPDATTELALPDSARVEVMIEFDDGEDPGRSQERLWRYDLFLSGWAHLLDRYRPPARTPILVMVCPDQQTLMRLLEIADQALTTRVAKAGSDPARWPYLARESILFALESDIHHGHANAVALPPRPSRGPDRPADRQLQPRPAQIIDSRLLMPNHRADASALRRAPSVMLV